MSATKSSINLRSLYKALRPILKAPRIGLFGFLFLILMASTLNAATPVFSSAKGPTLLPGSPPDKTVGAKYIYQNVETSTDGVLVDAILTITDMQNAFIWTSPVDDILNTDERFEPGIYTTAPGGYIEFQVEFVRDGTVTQASDTGVRANLGTFVMEAIDVDGEEFFEAIVTNSYTLQNPTELTAAPSPAGGGFTRFQSGTNNQGGIGLSPDFAVSINYENVQTIRFRYGHAQDSGNRWNSLGFAGEITFTNPVTTTVNVAPTVVDKLGNTVQPATAFNIDLLVGANDADGNMDPSTVVLTDPNDVTNVGSVGNPLVIPGVGTYTVDANGSLSFTSVAGYNGSANVLFTVSDTLGVSSNPGTLGLTVDGTPPTVVIQNAPAIVNSTTPYNVTFEFSEDVSGFAIGDITVGNGA
ncbi:MAG TPA: hypothetical protein EYH06_13785, partial [Chromatiales bacterium]|nr:hypothetical protein [Chromatiales bacterium]